MTPKGKTKKASQGARWVKEGGGREGSGREGKKQYPIYSVEEKVETQG